MILRKSDEAIASSASVVATAMEVEYLQRYLCKFEVKTTKSF